jgi:hypothetical protein
MDGTAQSLFSIQYLRPQNSHHGATTYNTGSFLSDLKIYPDLLPGSTFLS